MRRLGLSALALSLLVAVLLMLSGHPLWAQADTTTASDKLGIFGPVLDHFWPVIVTFLTSLVVKGISLANAGFAKTSAPVKWAALYFFALAFNLFARWIHITEVDPLAPTFALSAVQTGAAALIFRFGQHRVPANS